MGSSMCFKALLLEVLWSGRLAGCVVRRDVRFDALALGEQHVPRLTEQ